MYGEEDTTLIPTIIKFSIKLNNKICRFGGSGGRHQFVYAGEINKVLEMILNTNFCFYYFMLPFLFLFFF